MSLVQKVLTSQKDDPRRPSMAVKTLALPNIVTPGVRRGSSETAGPRNSISFANNPRTSLSVANGPRASMSVAGGPRTSLANSTRGPSLIGLLASKRLAKQLTSRFRSHGGLWGSRLSGQGVPVQKEPTYRMEPGTKFNPDKVERLLKNLLEDRLGKMRYSPKICPNMCKILSEEIKQKVKQLNFDRYKIVCNVTIGQKKDQSVVTSSRCVWDDKLDNYASYAFQNEHIFCTAIVFGVYTE